jgi:glycosyltransferase involved in cell wall biosynthesis
VGLLMAKVAVIITLYNKSQYIRRALDSVVAQTFDDFEVIVVDDGSTDDGPEVVQSCADPRVRLIRQENAGPGAARNRGVKESTAPWVAFLDADDEWLPGFLRVSIEALENHPECTVSVTSRYLGHLREDTTARLKERGLSTGVWFLREGSDVASLEQVRAPFWTGAVLCRRDVFEKCGGFYDRVRVICGEDTYLWLQLIVNCGIFMILQPLVWYHCEASDLGHRWKDAGVLQPCYFDPEPIRRNCPEPHRRLLEELLTAWAFRRATQLCERQDVGSASQICRVFPRMKRSPWKYAKLRMKMSCPTLCRMLRRARVSLSPS